MYAPRFLRLICWFSATMLIGSAGARAQLAANSPFLPSGTGTSGSAVTEGAPIELRGVMETRAGMSFCIFDPSRKVSAWVKLNEKDHDFVVKAYDANNETVPVDHGGRALTLALRAVKVASSGQASAPAPLPSPGMPLVPNAITQSVVANPTSADEQRRLEAVAAEVRRRRALREQASLQAASAPPVVEAPPAPPAQNQNKRQNNNSGQTPNRTRQRN